jgi:hypothetical protein
MFQLTLLELENLKSQIATSSWEYIALVKLRNAIATLYSNVAL